MDWNSSKKGHADFTLTRYLDNKKREKKESTNLSVRGKWLCDVDFGVETDGE